MGGALIGPVEHVPPAQKRNQGARCEAANKSSCRHNGASRSGGIKMTSCHKLIEA